MPLSQYIIRFQQSLAEVPAENWNACAKGNSCFEHPNPFISHAFLLALEIAKCTGGRTGWNPAHVLIETAEGELVAAAPCYLKTHSQGEYVFDHGWAEAFERAGGQYYPKVQLSAPFSPVPGPRLLIKAGKHEQEARKVLLKALRRLRDQTGASSIHVTFTTKEEWDLLGEEGFLQRIDQQFHWQNAGYSSFDAFLESLSSRKRKMIRRERRDAVANGITIEHLTGKNLQEKHWDAFYSFYEDTGARKWGRPYLNRQFFSEISRTMGEHILLIMAKRDERYIAGAINLIGSEALYGRNWGCCEDHPFLHFEVCYYQAIDFAIQNNILRVEAGAQGEHKLARGYMPSTTYSAHYIANTSLRRAVSDYLDREREHVVAVQKALAEEGPFRKSADEAGSNP